MMKQFRAALSIDYKTHVLQSAGVLGFAELAGVFDIVRAGIVLYGISPLPEFQNLLKPVMTWKTRISLVREMAKGSSISYGRTFITPRKMRVATLSAGYAPMDIHGTFLIVMLPSWFGGGVAPFSGA